VALDMVDTEVSELVALSGALNTGSMGRARQGSSIFLALSFSPARTRFHQQRLLRLRRYGARHYQYIFACVVSFFLYDFEEVFSHRIFMVQNFTYHRIRYQISANCIHCARITVTIQSCRLISCLASAARANTRYEALIILLAMPWRTI